MNAYRATVIATLSKARDLAAMLRADAEAHRSVASDCDCDPKDTANWQHAVNADAAADELERIDGILMLYLFSLELENEGRASLLRPAITGPGQLGPCHCPPDACQAPVIMGRQVACSRKPV